MSFSAYPMDKSDEILSSFVYDYMRKRGFTKSAESFKEEIESIRDGAYKMHPPPVDSQTAFLFTWFGMFWDVFSKRFPATQEKEPRAGRHSGISSSGQQEQAQGQPPPAKFGGPVIPHQRKRAGGIDLTGQPDLTMNSSAVRAGAGGFMGGALMPTGDGPGDVMVMSVAGGGVGVTGDVGGADPASSLGLTSVQYAQQKGMRGGPRKGRGGRGVTASEVESVSEHTGDLLDGHKAKEDDGDLVNMEGSTNSTSGGKKRGAGGREGKAPQKRARSGNTSAGVGGRVPRGTAPSGRDMGAVASDENYPTAYVAAVHAAAQAAAGAGEPIPSDSKPTRITQRGLFILQDQQYKLWPGGNVVTSLPSDHEEAQVLIRKGRVSWHESAAENQMGQMSKRGTEDDGMLLANTDSVSSKSAAVDGRNSLPLPNISEKSVESGVGENNSSHARIKESGSRKGMGRGKSRAGMDAEGSHSMGGGPERGRQRSNKGAPNARQAASAAVLPNAAGNMGGPRKMAGQGQLPKTVSILNSGRGKDVNEPRVLDPHDTHEMYSNFFSGLGGAGAGAGEMTSKVAPSLPFEGVPNNEVDDQVVALEGILNGNDEENMRLMGGYSMEGDAGGFGAESRVMAPGRNNVGEISTLRRNQ